MKERMMKRLAITAAVFLGGCAAPKPMYNAAVLSRERFSVRSPSVVLDSPTMVYAAAGPGEVPWWYDRADERLNVRWAAGASDVTDYAVQQIDRQQSFGGVIDDVYQRNFYSWRRGQYAR